MTQRWGLTIPYDDLPLAQQQERMAALPDLGYTDVWSAEVDGVDGFTPLVLASQWAPGLRLGCAIWPAFTRGPATMASCVAGLCEAAPGRVVVGVGSSSNVIVERWNGIAFDRPYQRTRDMVRFLRDALGGEKVKRAYDTFEVNGFRLARPVADPPKIVVAALRSGMLKMAGREADGAILNWLAADDVPTVTKYVHDQGEGKEIVARIFVCPTDDADHARGVGRFAIGAYLNVPVYREFHRWLGRDELEPMWKAWEAGDRAAASAAIPESVIDQLLVWGSPENCREHLQRYVDNGVHTPALAILPFGGDPWEATKSLAP